LDAIGHPNRIILIDPVFQAFGKQRGLAAIYPLNEALHPIPPQVAQQSYRENHSDRRVFTQPGSRAKIQTETLLDVDTPPKLSAKLIFRGYPASITSILEVLHERRPKFRAENASPLDGA
jgi:hypothetical protein